VNAVPATLASAAAADLGAALRVAHVSKRFGGVQAVDDVSLAVAPGEAVAVIGPNGAGKSSLLKLLSGVYTPDSGTIHLNEQRTDGRRREAVARLGVSLAHQVPQPFRGLTVGENVAIGALSSGRRAPSSSGSCGSTWRSSPPLRRCSAPWSTVSSRTTTASRRWCVRTTGSS